MATQDRNRPKGQTSFPTYNTPLKCLQQNLQHSRAATLNLTKLITESNIDIAFLQEPYLHGNKPTGMPTNYKIFSSDKGKCRTAIAVTKDSITAIIINQLSNGDATTMEVRRGEQSFIAVSMYFDILQDIEQDLAKVKEILKFADRKGIIIAIDSNSRSSLWHDITTNTRGKRLAEFILENHLFVTNADTGQPTFQTRRGSSWIDLTLCNEKFIKEVRDWTNLNEESCSDHRVISFQIGTPTTTTKEVFQFLDHRYKVREEDWTQFEEIFAKEAKSQLTEPLGDIAHLDQKLESHVLRQPDPEEIANNFQATLAEACKKSFKILKPSTRELKHKSVPWWTMELTVMRKKTNACRRRYQRTTGNEELRQERKYQYHEAKRAYQNAIRQRKHDSWKEYCNITSSANPWNAVYKLSSGKTRRKLTHSTLKKHDGSYTTGIVETLNFAMDHFSPTDDEQTDSAYHRNIRQKTTVTPDTRNDIPFTSYEIKNIIDNMNWKKAPGEDGITSQILSRAFAITPLFITAIYNKCLDTGHFPKIWKRAKIIPIIKPGKERSVEVNKYRPISLLNVAGKVLEKLFINRIMYFLYSNDLLHDNQYGFRPQTSTVDAITKVTDTLEGSLQRNESVAMISLDVEGAFDGAWWPGILNALKDFRCPKNLYELTRSYLSARQCSITENDIYIEREPSKGCPQGSCCGPGLWNIYYNSLLNMDYNETTEIVAYADDILVLVRGTSTLEIENKANIELRKVSKWAENNKIRFNKKKSQVMLVSRKKPRSVQKLNIYLGNGKIEQTSTIKYLGVLIDSRLTYNQHIQLITEKAQKLIHSLSRSAYINWGLRSDVISIIYRGAILPLISYGVSVWIKALNVKSNIRRLTRIQRLINIKITKAFRTTSNEALCLLSGNTPIHIELTAMANYYNIIKGRPQPGDVAEDTDTAKSYKIWPHPATDIPIREMNNEGNYAIKVYTDGSKSEEGVGAGIAVYSSHEAVRTRMFRLHSRCSNNQAEQLAILKALEELASMQHTPLKTAAIHTDSRVALDLLRNNPRHSSLTEDSKFILDHLQQNGWTIHFTWVKAHVGNEGNELADNLAKLAANSPEMELAYNLIPNSTIKREQREISLQTWENEWKNSSNGSVTKEYFPTVKSRLRTKLPLSHNFTAMTTGHGRLGAYFHRFHISQDPTCVCKKSPQTVDHILWDCELLKNERLELRSDIIIAVGSWPTAKTNLIEKHLTVFSNFVKKINFDILQTT